jgi:hypothetical protein
MAVNMVSTSVHIIAMEVAPMKVLNAKFEVDLKI